MQAIISVLLILATIGVVLIFIATAYRTDREGKMLNMRAIPIFMVLSALDMVVFGTGTQWLILGYVFLGLGSVMCYMQLQLERMTRRKETTSTG